MTVKSSKSKKSASSASQPSSPVHAAHQSPADRSSMRAQLKASRQTFRAESPTQLLGLHSSLNPTQAGLNYSSIPNPLQPSSSSASHPSLPPSMSLPAAAASLPGAGPSRAPPPSMTSLDVAASAERLMMSGYHYDAETAAAAAGAAAAGAAAAGAPAPLPPRDPSSSSRPGSRPSSRPPTPPAEGSPLAAPSPPPNNVTDAIGLLSSVVNSAIPPGLGAGNPSVLMNTHVAPIAPGGHFFNSSDAPGGDSPPAPPAAGVASAYASAPPPAGASNPAFASSTECLHLTLLLRRTLSELDSRSKHLNEAGLEKLALHSQVEKCKLRLEQVVLETEELRRRTAEAEEKARAVIDDEQNAINEARSQQAAAEKRFEILVDWSRKEESKRIVAEDTMREALDRLDEQEGRHEEEAGQLRRDCLALREALDASNEANAAKHRQLLEREAQYMEVSKELAVADKLATTCERESSALKHLCGKLEVELDGTKSRLKSVEVSSSNHISEISESVKVLQRDNAGAARELEHWKKAYENSEHKSGALLNDVEEAKRALKMSESRVAEVLGNQRQYEHKIDMLAKENDELKRQMWSSEKAMKDADARAQLQSKEVNKLLEKNESLNRMVDGLEDDFKERTRAGLGSPSLLKYDVVTGF
ncbi:hypothetical protein TeGR_g12166 [Tetraparma gracilis]|uniref:Uncharacterized protein n=1 Tax=Tetraparma gracilis TaxID=2962635 RepID=A0ABQ6MCK5_9STRA|nr:hypothetical protein TeGR_g12166 [Tetraparma gracilis]